MPAPTASGGTKVSGIAPRAYIGNYKALSVPTDANVGLDGNAPELVAAIEAAVADGMDVINMSLGEPEIEPSRDIVARALDAAAAGRASCRSWRRGTTSRSSAADR
jgi:subtilisin family serine protease